MHKQPLIGTLNMFSSGHILPFLLNSRVLLSLLSPLPPQKKKEKKNQCRKRKQMGSIVLKSKKYNHYNGHQY
ncbi:hypothetical protein GYH30_011792 [Glycine max]|uniref:Uncharacterized protein n=1 Tax=Glycine max TaxID=3847 RepID=K7KN84_SOYBN|nr:hypothetical protein GYH30_011792 [Glycine max]